MQTSIQFELPGANPFTLEGPIVAGSGKPGPNFRLGSAIAVGDAAAEFIYCQLTLAAQTTLSEGQLYTYDKDFNASLLSTANSPRGQNVAAGRVNQANVPAGTYYIWLQRAGNCPVISTGNANALGETTATAGVANFTNAPTVGSKLIVGLYLYLNSFAFTGNTVNGSNQITGCSNLADVALGATIAGAGIPGGSTVQAIDKTNGIITLNNNATATANTVALTASGVNTANIAWPYIDKTN